MKKINAFDIVLTLLSLVLCLGTAFLFHPCGPKVDGSWMLCHWARNVIIALGAVFSAASIARFFLNDNITTGISISFIPLSVITCLVPGILVKMCGMKDMRCWSVMRPCVLVFSIAICVISVVDIILTVTKNRKK